MIYCGIMLTFIMLLLAEIESRLTKIYLELWDLNLWRRRNDKTRFGT